ncbi:hypothetical protein Lupro_11790 [Lutibacter profundi]|uniref:Serine protease n=1 Tax=Lutibacter profundi TaxID=1622118 RepID=A0A120IEK0_9FLAO|nr:serine protease [Lutibacter profundi]AMC11904.1 hypothetical protein Lupro_11790 [Lutibacter profundi]
MDILNSNINSHQPTAYDYVFPVFGGILTKEGHFNPKNIFGTAFYIENNFFITCAHTIKKAEEQEIVALGFQNEQGQLSFSKIRDSEVFEDNDSGILVASIERAKSYPWLSQKLAMLNNVMSVGYAFGFDNKHSEVLIRAFKGHITMVGYNHNFPKTPAHYELSYMCPRGISGAPLLFKHKNQPYICGFTVGNEQTSMIVWSSEDIEEETNSKTVYQREESFHRGIAMQSKSFFELESKLLGMKIIDYLKSTDLLK